MANKASIEAVVEEERERLMTSDGAQLSSGALVNQFAPLLRPDYAGAAVVVEVPRGDVSCPFCGSDSSRVVTPYWLPDGRVKRNRRCSNCGEKFITIETPGEAEPEYAARRAAALAMKEKQCSLCKQVLPIESFGRKDAIYPRSRCRECLNRRRSECSLRENLKRYGITVHRYEEMLAAQNGGCTICGKRNVRHSHGTNRQPLVFDHCHKTGRFRGLLCQRCNRAIGLFGDSVETIEAALTYLRIPQQPEEVMYGK